MPFQMPVGDELSGDATGDGLSPPRLRPFSNATASWACTCRPRGDGTGIDASLRHSRHVRKQLTPGTCRGFWSSACITSMTRGRPTPRRARERRRGRARKGRRKKDSAGCLQGACAFVQEESAPPRPPRCRCCGGCIHSGSRFLFSCCHPAASRRRPSLLRHLLTLSPRHQLQQSRQQFSLPSQPSQLQHSSRLHACQRQRGSLLLHHHHYRQAPCCEHLRKNSCWWSLRRPSYCLRPPLSHHLLHPPSRHLLHCQSCCLLHQRRCLMNSCASSNGRSAPRSPRSIKSYCDYVSKWSPAKRRG